MRNRPDPFGERRDPEGRSWGPVVLAVVTLLVVAAVAWLWWSRNAAPSGEVRTPPSVAETLPPLPAVEPAVRYPLDEAEPPADITAALADLFGRKAVLALLQTHEFPRRFVATVDSLGRAHSPPALWPVVPPGGRFTAQRTGETAVLAPANSARYEPLVRLAESMDVGKAADLYRSIYPQLQSAYEELGYGRRYFNDRVIEVIDQLLAAPEPAGPVQLQQLVIKGPMADPRPWVRWEFVDPQLQSLTAGQKIMVRMGAQNERRLKARLVALRSELVRGRAR
ncbi:DUF3014 domain-containing protein [Ramlibacter sp. AW1]|uniref:DUF3014 domain-containing protein n=1 Tax=Ramlibacter aurantiacus TaxID=2801330 RepID=A0A937D1P1_9BURK|nr:DUF3014 domain-containing protein [Ramlibacter aurantiacus]MBL0418970.1 DUF3014 domain-containing protein [Ramlibacter aurantiacus]